VPRLEPRVVFPSPERRDADRRCCPRLRAASSEFLGVKLALPLASTAAWPTHLLDRFLGGPPNLLGCLRGRLSSATTGEAPNRLLGDVAHLGGLANDRPTFAILILRG
jgi:hypothetical protein